MTQTVSSDIKKLAVKLNQINYSNHAECRHELLIPSQLRTPCWNDLFSGICTQFIYFLNSNVYIAIALCSKLLHSAIAIGVRMYQFFF
jgi:hypothetical protein